MRKRQQSDTAKPRVRNSPIVSGKGTEDLLVLKVFLYIEM